MQQLLTAIVFLWSLSASGTDEPVRFTYAGEAQAREALLFEDFFLQSQTPADWAFRVGKKGATRAEYLDLLAGSPRPWTDAHIERLEQARLFINSKLSHLDVDLPDIVVVSYSGASEGNTGHTRRNLLIMPMWTTERMSDEQLHEFLLHEIFHIYSRFNPEGRKKLYGIIGYEVIGAIKLPEVIERQRLTNPDAPTIDAAIRLVEDGRQTVAVPVLLYPETEVTRPFPFEAINGKLMAIDTTDNGGWQPILHENTPVLIDPQGHPDLLRQIGRNGYPRPDFHHPEEAMADNFAAAVLGKTSPDPWVLNAVRDVLHKTPTAEQNVQH